MRLGKGIDRQIKVGREYHYDVSGICKDLHIGTRTVRVDAVIPRTLMSPLVRVTSVQTGERFTCDAALLQIDPRNLRKRYHALLHAYKQENPELLLQWDTLWPRRGKGTLVAVGYDEECNLIEALDSSGIVRRFSYMTMPHLDLPVNLARKAMEDQEAADYAAEVEADRRREYAEEEIEITDQPALACAWIDGPTL